MQQDTRSVEVCIRLLGMPAWWHPGGGPPVALSRKDAAVLAVLALDGPQPRERLAALIWPDVPAARASSNLRQRLFRLRQQTGHLLIDNGELLRPAAGLRMDLQQLDGADTAADMPIDPGEELLGALDFAEDGDLLDDWVRRARQVWRTRRVDLLTGRAARHEATGELAAALATVERLLTIDPLQEHAWRRLMRLHHRRGDRAAAVAAFERCEQVLKDELGLKPSGETRDLLAAIEHAEAQPASRQPLPPALIRPAQRVGRESEWQQMLAAWQAGRPFLLVGDAGLGKSRLLSDLAQAEPDCLLSRALPGDEQVPYATLARVLRLAVARDGLLLTLPVRAELSRLLPELGRAPASPADENSLRQAVDQALVAARDSGLTAILVDDLHHADPASLGSLHRHAGSEQGLRLGFSCRPERRTEDGRLTLALLTDSVRASPIPLSPLAEDEAALLVHSLLSVLPEPLPQHEGGREGLAQDLLRWSGGNPFFAIETLKSWLMAGQGGAAAAPLAPSVGALIEQRLKPLSADGLGLARIAALAGADFSAELAARVMDRPLLSLADAWAELEAMQLLRADGFASELMRVAVHEAMPQAVRVALQRRVAAVLEGLGAPAERVAWHHAQAADWAAAARAERQAVDAAARLGRRAEEWAHAQQSAAWFDQAGLAAEAFDARVAGVSACAAACGLPAARAHVEALLQSPLLVDPVLPASRRRLARARMAAGLVLGDEGDFEAALQHGAVAVAATRIDEELGWQARSAQAMTLALCGRADEAVALLEPVLPHARLQASRTVLGDVLHDLAYVLNYASRRRDAVRLLEEALDLPDAEGHRHHELVGLVNLAVQYAVLGRQSEAIAAGWRARQLALDLGPSLDSRNNEVNLGMFLVGVGRYREALDLLHEVLAHARRHAPGTALQHCAEEFLAEAWLAMGCEAQARQALSATPLPEVATVRLAFRLDLLARLAEPMQAPELWAQALQACEVATPMPTRVRVRLNASLAQPPAAALALCDAAAAEASQGEYPPGELLAALRRAHAQRRAGDLPAACLSLDEALRAHEAGVRHVFVPLPELFGLAAQVWGERGRQGDAAAAARARWALASGQDWLQQTLSGGQLPDEALPHFVAGQPWVRWLAGGGEPPG